MEKKKPHRSYVDEVMSEYKNMAEGSSSSSQNKGLEKATYNGKNTDISLGQLNGIGLAFMGDFRSDNGAHGLTFATYHFFTIFYLPIIPFGCYRVKIGAYDYINHKRSKQHYTIYGTEKWKITEVLRIYMRYVIPLLVIFAGVCLYYYLSR